ncbi:MAG: hypothetical protein GY838_15745, partial [bacterium]|nr:hypothetical protein [bacterium]
QAAEINAGRGEDLRLGPYVLKAKLSSLGYARRYAVRHVQSGDCVELLVVEGLSNDRQEDAIESLASVTKRASELTADGLAPALECGHEAGRAWIAMPTVSGPTATDHVVRHGRMPPEVVLEIARQMVAALTHLEQVGLVHGDVSATTAVLTEQGRAVLLAPGLRPIVRPAEGFAHTDLAPEYYDSVAPEQIDGG